MLLTGSLANPANFVLALALNIVYTALASSLSFMPEPFLLWTLKSIGVRLGIVKGGN